MTDPRVELLARLCAEMDELPRGYTQQAEWLIARGVTLADHRAPLPLVEGEFVKRHLAHIRNALEPIHSVGAVDVARDSLTQLVAALSVPASSERASQGVWWLIEQPGDGSGAYWWGGEARYWETWHEVWSRDSGTCHREDLYPFLTQDASKAVRFRSKQDAESVIKLMPESWQNQGLVVTDHRWMSDSWREDSERAQAIEESAKVADVEYEAAAKYVHITTTDGYHRHYSEGRADAANRIRQSIRALSEITQQAGGGTYACPICGRDTPHRHDGEKEDVIPGWWWKRTGDGGNWVRQPQTMEQAGAVSPDSNVMGPHRGPGHTGSPAPASPAVSPSHVFQAAPHSAGDALSCMVCGAGPMSINHRPSPPPGGLPEVGLSKDNLDALLGWHERYATGMALLAIPPLVREYRRLNALLNTPEVEDFDIAVPLEASHQVIRWGAPHDTGKNAEDWFWLVGYLAGKALAAQKAGDTYKAKHHCVSTAAALRNWHAHLRSGESEMRPGIEPPAALASSPVAPEEKV